MKGFISVSHSLWQKNVITAEEYIYSPSRKKYVIIGSSLSGHINKSILPDGFYNISFSGGSIYEGMELAKKSNVLPEIMFIEMNLFLRPMQSDFNKSMSFPGMILLKKYLPALQEKNQPINIFFPCLVKIYYNIKKIFIPENKKVVATPQDGHARFPQQSKIKKSKVFSIMLGKEQKKYKIPPQREIVESQIKILKKYVEYFDKKNITIVFFEMPVDATLCSMPWPDYSRNILYKEFTRDKYFYIAQPDCGQFETADGLHLDSKSGIEYTKYFVKEFNNTITSHKYGHAGG